MSDKGKPQVPIFIDTDLCSSSEEADDGTPLRPIFCLKKKDKMKELEEREECFILEFDPDEVDNVTSSDHLRFPDSAFASDVSFVSERGQVACRDYPHPRHVCVKNPFAKSSHESYCGLCYCYVCDVSAPCKKWTGLFGHCHAFDNEAWKLQRKQSKRALDVLLS